MINISTCTRVLACNWKGLKIEKKENAEVFLSRQIYIDIKLIIEVLIFVNIAYAEKDWSLSHEILSRK